MREGNTVATYQQVKEMMRREGLKEVWKLSDLFLKNGIPFRELFKMLMKIKKEEEDGK